MARAENENGAVVSLRPAGRVNTPLRSVVRARWKQRMIPTPRTGIGNELLQPRRHRREYGLLAEADRCLTPARQNIDNQPPAQFHDTAT